FLVAHNIRSKADFLQDSRRNPKAADLEPLLTALEATAVYYGSVVLQRFAEERKPITSRIRKAPAAGADAIEWFVRWLTAAAAPDFDSRLREMRPHLSPYLVLQVGHVVQDGQLVPSKFELSS